MDEEETADSLAAPGVERRARPRFPVEEDASLLLVENGLSAQCRIVDLNLEGCRLRTRERLVAAIRARVEVTFKINGIAFRLSGVIRWLDGVRVVGIRFAGMSSRRREEWAEVLGEVEETVPPKLLSGTMNKLRSKPRPSYGWKNAKLSHRNCRRRKLLTSLRPQPARTIWADIPSAGSSQAYTPEPAALQLASQEPTDAATRERRKQCRHEVDTSAVILLIQAGSRLSGRILDLSLSGCRIRTDQRFPVGIYTRVETEFQLEGLPFRLVGVIQAIHDRRLVGIRFLDMSDRKREQVEQLVEEIAEIETTHSRHNVAKNWTKNGDSAEIAGEVPEAESSPSSPGSITNDFDQ